MNKYFPFSYKAKDLVGLIVSIVLYIVAGAVGGLVIGLLSAIPVIGIIAWVLGLALDIYCVVGLVLAILVFLKVVK